MNEMLPDSAPSHLDPAESTDGHGPLDSVAPRYDVQRVDQLLRALQPRAGCMWSGVSQAFTTPYVNSILADLQPARPISHFVRRVRSCSVDRTNALHESQPRRHAIWRKL